MKHFLALLFVASTFGFCQGANPCPDNSEYPTEIIERVLSSSVPFATGQQERLVNRLGDKAAIAVMKIVTPEKRAQPEEAVKIIAIIREAFARPEIVSLEEDRTPEVSQMLLLSLQERVTDAKVRASIKETISYVDHQTQEFVRQRQLKNKRAE